VATNRTGQQHQRDNATKAGGLGPREAGCMAAASQHILASYRRQRSATGTGR
jgi:hypothetical protein